MWHFADLGTKSYLWFAELKLLQVRHTYFFSLQIWHLYLAAIVVVVFDQLLPLNGENCRKIFPRNCNWTCTLKNPCCGGRTISIGRLLLNNLLGCHYKNSQFHWQHQRPVIHRPRARHAIQPGLAGSWRYIPLIFEAYDSGTVETVL